MPHAMPIGIPTTHESSNNSPDPTMALPMPPPSPTGRGVSIRNRRFSAAIPRIAMYARITNRTPTAANVHSAVSEVMTALTERRDRSELVSFAICYGTATGREREHGLRVESLDPVATAPGSDTSCSCSCRPPRHAPNHQPRHSIHYESNEEENQTKFDQRTQINICCGFSEFVRDD